MLSEFYGVVRKRFATSKERDEALEKLKTLNSSYGNVEVVSSANVRHINVWFPVDKDSIGISPKEFVGVVDDMGNS